LPRVLSGKHGLWKLLKKKLILTMFQTPIPTDLSESFEDSDASTDSDFIGDDEIPHHLNNQEAKEFWKATLNGAAPEQHALSAKRKIGRGGNKGTGRVKKSRHNKSDPTGVSGKDIVVKFPNEPLMLVDGKPHCKACHCPVAIKL